MCPNLIGSSFGHEHSTPPIGFAVERLISNHTHRFNLASVHLTKTRTHKWNVTIKVTRTHTHRYVVGHILIISKTHRWNSGGKIRKSKRHKWNITTKRVRTHIHKYIIAIKVTKSKTHKYKVSGRIYKTKTHKWNQAGHIYDNAVKTHKYNIIKKITRTHRHNYSVLVPKIAESDLQYFKSTATNSLGGAITANTITTSLKHDLFDAVTGAETASGDTEYRCLYVKNISNAKSTLVNAKVWINTNTPSTGSNVTIGLGTSAIDGIEQTVDTEGTVPSGVSFVTAAGVINALAIGTLNGGQHKAVWLKRVITADSDAYIGDNFVLGFGGDAYASDM